MIAALAAFPLVLGAGPATASGMTNCPHTAAATPAANCGAVGCPR